jgi:hypothetical protein
MDTSTEKTEEISGTSLDGFEDRIKPIGRKYMHYKGIIYTPCEVLREIYQMTDDLEIKLRCRIVSRMVKVMAGKITKVDGAGWEQHFWPKKERVDETDKSCCG